METACITIALVTFGNDEEAMKTILNDIEKSCPTGTVAQWFCEETTLHKEFEAKAKAYPINHCYCVDTAWLKNDADVVEVIEEAFTTLPTKKSLVLWNTMIPRSRRNLSGMALSLQSDHYVAIYGICQLESEYSACETWIRETMAKVEKHEIGAYLGEFGLQARRARVWGVRESIKLMDIIRKWDPAGRFCGYLGLEDTDLATSRPRLS